MKNITEKQLIKILSSNLPHGYDEKSVKVRTCPYSSSNKIKELSVVDAILGRKVWFYYYQDEKKRWVLSMDGANSWDYLSTESDYYFDSMITKFINSFRNVDLYPHPLNHYSFVLDN